MACSCGGCLGEAAEFECNLNAGMYSDPEPDEWEAWSEGDALECLEMYFRFTDRQVTLIERKNKGKEAFAFMRKKVREAKKECLKEFKIH